MFMNRYVNIGLALGISACLGAAVQLSAQAKPETAKPAMEKPQTAKPAPDTAKPQTAKPQTAKPAMQSSAQAGGAVSLGSVRIPRAVKGDGQPLPAGTYTVRV